MTMPQLKEVLEKFSQNELSDKEIIEAVTFIKSAEEIVKKGPDTCGRNDYKKAKKIVDEIHRFDEKQSMIKVKKAQSIIFREPSALGIFDKHQFDRLNYMPINSKADRKKKRELKSELNMLYRSSKMIKKMFPNGIEEPDELELANALNMPETNRAEKKAKKLAVKAAQNRIKMFRKAAEPYVEAKTLIKKYNEYKKWKKLEKRYRELKNRAEA